MVYAYIMYAYDIHTFMSTVDIHHVKNVMSDLLY